MMDEDPVLFKKKLKAFLEVQEIEYTEKQNAALKKEIEDLKDLDQRMGKLAIYYNL